MRVITKKAIEAFENKKNFGMGNTTVVANGAVSGLYLFGNLIAEKIFTENGSYEVRVTNSGYFTNTTKERLNGIQGVQIQQKSISWLLNGEVWDGKWKTVRTHKV
jgi:hypothetical protein